MLTRIYMFIRCLFAVQLVFLHSALAQCPAGDTCTESNDTFPVYCFDDENPDREINGKLLFKETRNSLGDPVNITFTLDIDEKVTTKSKLVAIAFEIDGVELKIADFILDPAAQGTFGTASVPQSKDNRLRKKLGFTDEEGSYVNIELREGTKKEGDCFSFIALDPNDNLSGGYGQDISCTYQPIELPDTDMEMKFLPNKGAQPELLVKAFNFPPGLYSGCLEMPGGNHEKVFDFRSYPIEFTNEQIFGLQRLSDANFLAALNASGTNGNYDQYKSRVVNSASEFSILRTLSSIGLSVDKVDPNHVRVASDDGANLSKKALRRKKNRKKKRKRKGRANFFEIRAAKKKNPKQDTIGTFLNWPMVNGTSAPVVSSCDPAEPTCTPASNQEGTILIIAGSTCNKAGSRKKPDLGQVRCNPDDTGDTENDYCVNMESTNNNNSKAEELFTTACKEKTPEYTDLAVFADYPAGSTLWSPGESLRICLDGQLVGTTTSKIIPIPEGPYFVGGLILTDDSAFASQMQSKLPETESMSANNELSISSTCDPFDNFYDPLDPLCDSPCDSYSEFFDPYDPFCDTVCSDPANPYYSPNNESCIGYASSSCDPTSPEYDSMDPLCDSPCDPFSMNFDPSDQICDTVCDDSANPYYSPNNDLCVAEAGSSCDPTSPDYNINDSLCGSVCDPYDMNYDGSDPDCADYCDNSSNPYYSPDNDLCLGDICDPASPNFDPAAPECTGYPCDPNDPTYNPSAPECSGDVCDPENTYYDPNLPECGGDICDPANPFHDPEALECNPDSGGIPEDQDYGFVYVPNLDSATVITIVGGNATSCNAPYKRGSLTFSE